MLQELHQAYVAMNYYSDESMMHFAKKLLPTYVVMNYYSDELMIHLSIVYYCFYCSCW